MNKEVAEFYFKYLGNDLWECRCGRQRKQVYKKGYENLKSHILGDHPDWKAEFTSSQKQSTLGVSIASLSGSKKAKNRV